MGQRKLARALARTYTTHNTHDSTQLPLNYLYFPHESCPNSFALENTRFGQQVLKLVLELSELGLLHGQLPFHLFWAHLHVKWPGRAELVVDPPQVAGRRAYDWQQCTLT